MTSFSLGETMHDHMKAAVKLQQLHQQTTMQRPHFITISLKKLLKIKSNVISRLATKFSVFKPTV